MNYRRPSVRENPHWGTVAALVLAGSSRPSPSIASLIAPAPRLVPDRRTIRIGRSRTRRSHALGALAGSGHRRRVALPPPRSGFFRILQAETLSGSPRGPINRWGEKKTRGQRPAPGSRDLAAAPLRPEPTPRSDETVEPPWRRCAPRAELPRRLRRFTGNRRGSARAADAGRTAPCPKIGLTCQIIAININHLAQSRTRATCTPIARGPSFRRSGWKTRRCRRRAG